MDIRILSRGGRRNVATRVQQHVFDSEYPFHLCCCDSWVGSRELPHICGVVGGTRSLVASALHSVWRHRSSLTMGYRNRTWGYGSSITSQEAYVIRSMDLREIQKEYLT